MRLTEQQEAAARRAATASDHALEIVRSRQSNGLVSSLELLEAQRAALKHKRAETKFHYTRFIATSGLIRALGGSWQ